MLAYIEKHDLVNRGEEQYLNADAAFSAALYGSGSAWGQTRTVGEIGEIHLRPRYSIRTMIYSTTVVW